MVPKLIYTARNLVGGSGDLSRKEARSPTLESPSSYPPRAATSFFVQEHRATYVKGSKSSLVALRRNSRRKKKSRSPNETCHCSSSCSCFWICAQLITHRYRSRYRTDSNSASNKLCVIACARARDGNEWSVKRLRALNRDSLNLESCMAKALANEVYI